MPETEVMLYVYDERTCAPDRSSYSGACHCGLAIVQTENIVITLTQVCNAVHYALVGPNGLRVFAEDFEPFFADWVLPDGIRCLLMLQ